MRLSHYSGKLILAAIIAMGVNPLASAAAYVVNRGHALANDENPGTSTLPFRTISRAASIARPGDYVTVMSGTYTESVDVANSGTPSQPITFAASGNVLVVSPKQDNWTGVFNVVGKTDIVIAGFTVQKAYYGFRVEKDRTGKPSERVTLKGNRATLSRSSGIYVSYSRNVVVEANVVEKTNWGGVHEMISIINTDGFLVKNNDVRNASVVVDGVLRLGKEGIDAKEGSRNGRIFNNRVHDLNRLGIYVDAWDKPTYNIEVAANVVYRCRDGIAIASERGGLIKDILVVNNVAYNNQYAGINVPSWAGDGPRENIRIINNTLYGNAQGGIRIGTSNVYGVDIQNNIASDNGGAALYAVNSGLVRSANNNLVNGRVAGNILTGAFSGDPRFVSPATGNFRLNADSAAVNRGITVPHVPTDITGMKRPLGGVYDVGAFESR